MKNVFLDLGGNKGQGLRYFINKYNISPDNWIVETFEPDPNCNLELEISDLPFVRVNKKAIWTHDGEVEFSQMIDNTEGSSVECLMSEGSCADKQSVSFRKHDSIIKVECLDLSNILKKYSDFDFVLVKMDIEGSEFNVLRKIISNNTISIISELYVEWHQEYVKNENIETVNELKSKINSFGILLNDWI